MPKTLFGWAALVITVIWIATNPAQAGADIRNAADGVIAFARSL